MGGKVFHLNRRVNQEELDTFCVSWNLDDGMSCRACCDSTYFRFDLLGTPRSAWNKSAARVFAADYIKTNKLSKKCLEEVMEAFFTRIKNLQAQYKLQLKGPTVVLAAKIKRRRDFRKYSVGSETYVKTFSHSRQLFQRRIFIAIFIPLLRCHVDMLERLGVDGMSSDESDTEEVIGNAYIRRNNTRYRAKRPLWRATIVDAWLRVFDTCYVVWRRTATGSMHGSAVHVRGRSADNWSSSKSFVAGLEKNAYNHEWLSARADIDITVRPLDKAYAFNHDCRIYE